MARPALRFSLVLLALFTASGCAFVNRTTRVTWPAPGEPPVAEPAASAPAVWVSPLVDLRPEPRQKVGAVRNLFGMPTADVETPDDLVAWATAAIKDELQRAGVRVVPQAAGVPEVGGELTLANGEAFFTYRGEVELRAWLRGGGDLEFQRSIRGEATGAVNWVAAGEGYGEALTMAMKEAARQLARAVAAALKLPAPHAVPSS